MSERPRFFAVNGAARCFRRERSCGVLARCDIPPESSAPEARRRPARAASREWRTRWREIGTLALASALLVIAPRSAHAAPPSAVDDPNPSPFKVNGPLDIGITAGAMVLGGMPRLFA